MFLFRIIIITQLTVVTNALTRNLSVFFIQSCRQTRMFMFREHF